jgi:hypothetical protein
MWRNASGREAAIDESDRGPEHVVTRASARCVVHEAMDDPYEGNARGGDRVGHWRLATSGEPSHEALVGQTKALDAFDAGSDP